MASRISSNPIQQLELSGKENRALKLCEKHEDKLCAIIAKKVDKLFSSSSFQESLSFLDDPEAAHFNIRLTHKKIVVELVDGDGSTIGNPETFKLNHSARRILREADRIYQKHQRKCLNKDSSPARHRSSEPWRHRDTRLLSSSTQRRKDRHVDSSDIRTPGTRARSAERDFRLPSSHLSPIAKSTAAKREDKRRVSSSTESSPIATSTTSTRKRETSESPSFPPTQSPFKDSPLSDRSPEGTVRELSFNLYNLQNRLSTLRNSPKPTRTESREITALEKEIRQLRHEIAELKGLVENPHAAQFGHADFGSFPQTTASTYTDGLFSQPSADLRPSVSNGTEAQAASSDKLRDKNTRLKTRIQELEIRDENAQLKNRMKELEQRDEERRQTKIKKKEAQALLQEQLGFKLEVPFNASSTNKAKTRIDEVLTSREKERKISLDKARKAGNTRLLTTTTKEEEKQKANAKRNQQKLEAVKQTWESLPNVTRGHYNHKGNQRPENSRPKSPHTLNNTLTQSSDINSPFLTFKDEPTFNLTGSPLSLENMDSFEIQT